ncbi:hypothetical protein N431DRAFT_455228 [Stipitochalara longipes BDJ]|nr:hypothetical protein N431DRAFT_455228 [Stipitochalara longipes BDJ]
MLDLVSLLLASRSLPISICLGVVRGMAARAPLFSRAQFRGDIQIHATPTTTVPFPAGMQASRHSTHIAAPSLVRWDALIQRQCQSAEGARVDITCCRLWIRGRHLAEYFSSPRLSDWLQQNGRSLSGFHLRSPAGPSSGAIATRLLVVGSVAGWQHSLALTVFLLSKRALHTTSTISQHSVPPLAALIERNYSTACHRRFRPWQSVPVPDLGDFACPMHPIPFPPREERRQ